MSTNGSGLVVNTEARRGAARPNTETPTPPTSATNSSWPGETRAYADASTVSRAAGSSSNRSSDTQATRRSSAQRPLGQQSRLAVSRGRGDADHPAITRSRRLDEIDAIHQIGRGCGTEILASSSNSSIVSMVDAGRAERRPRRNASSSWGVCNPNGSAPSGQTVHEAPGGPRFSGFHEIYVMRRLAVVG